MGKLTCCSNWPGTQREGKKRGAPMASVESRLGENALARYREGGSGNGGGDGVFRLTVELTAVVGEAEAHLPAPFIGGQGRRR
jgi:hypothetical protein